MIIVPTIAAEAEVLLCRQKCQRVNSVYKPVAETTAHPMHCCAVTPTKLSCCKVECMQLRVRHVPEHVQIPHATHSDNQSLLLPSRASLHACLTTHGCSSMARMAAMVANPQPGGPAGRNGTSRSARLLKAVPPRLQDPPAH